MRAQTYLDQVKKIDDEINCMIEEREELDALILGAVSYDDTGASSTNKISKPTEEHALRAEEYSQSINKKVDELVDLKHKITLEIDRVCDRTLRNLLRHRYLLGKTWQVVADDMSYDLRWIYRLHREALREFEKANSDIFQ